MNEVFKSYVKASHVLRVLINTLNIGIKTINGRERIVVAGKPVSFAGKPNDKKAIIDWLKEISE